LRSAEPKPKHEDNPQRERDRRGDDLGEQRLPQSTAGQQGADDERGIEEVAGDRGRGVPGALFRSRG
jgi:hypothetical protein